MSSIASVPSHGKWHGAMAIVLTSLRDLPLSSKQNIKKLRDSVFPSRSPTHTQRVEAVILHTEAGLLLWACLTLWNPLSTWPNSCCLFTSYNSCPKHQLVGKPQRKVSAPTHSCSSELPVGCWLAGSLPCRLLKEQPSLVCLRSALMFL